LLCVLLGHSTWSIILVPTTTSNNDLQQE
jgi:hypothetical protein